MIAILEALPIIGMGATLIERIVHYIYKNLFKSAQVLKDASSTTLLPRIATDKRKEQLLEQVKKGKFSYEILEFEEDEDFFCKIASIQPNFLEDFPESLKKNRKVVLAAATSPNPSRQTTLQHCDPMFYNDREIIIESLKNAELGRWNENLIPGPLRDDENFIDEFRKVNELVILIASDRVKKYLIEKIYEEKKAACIADLKRNDTSSFLSNEKFWKDDDLVFAAVKVDPKLLHHVVTKVKKNRCRKLFDDAEIVKASLVGEDEATTRSILRDERAENLANNEAFIYDLMTVNQYALSCIGWALKQSLQAKDFQKEKEKCINQLKCGDTSLFISELKKFFDDFDVILAAVKTDPRLLKHAILGLQMDRQIVLAAAQSESEYRDRTLEYCGLIFSSDKEIVKSALKNSKNIESLRGYVSYDLRDDEAFILELMKENEDALYLASFRVFMKIQCPWWGPSDFDTPMTKQLNSCIDDLIDYMKKNEKIVSDNKDLSQIAQSIISNKNLPEKILDLQEGKQINASNLKKKYHSISLKTSPNSARNNQNPDKAHFATYLHKCIDAAYALIKYKNKID